ncbi:scale keratin-like [Manacus candei]|nr:scale keratin-like isoform X6 [Manacus candei]XP_051627016.1 scale keratin-like [Manacus candei]
MLTQGGAGAAQPWCHQQQGVSPVPIGPAGAEHCWGCYKRPGRARLCQAALATLSSGKRSSSASLAEMSCYDLCPPKGSVAVPKPSVAVPQPIAESCNELCARQCPDSTAFIQPPPVVVTFPGPILSSFPQQAVVGSAGAPAFGGSLGLGGLYGQGATQASGGLCTFPTACAAPACSPWLLPRYSRKVWDTCGPC